jgi:hypothetical protein
MIVACKLKIVDYFDSVINKLDLKVEKILSSKACDVEQRNVLNTRRDLFISHIKECELFNLQTLERIKNLEELDENSPNLKIFVQFCFLIDENISQNKEELGLGFLVITDRFLTNEQLDKYKGLFKFKHDMSSLEFLNPYFNIKYNKVCFKYFLVK